MSQILGKNSIDILSNVKQEGKITVYSFIKKYFKHESYRKIYTHIYQLEKRGYLERYKHKDLEYLKNSSKAEAALAASSRKRDGKWKMIIVRELKTLSDKMFIRLLTIESINNETGLKELFE